MLESAISETKETLLTGDLNVNYLKKADHKEIKDIIDLYGLKQIIQKPTRIQNDSETLIDIIATNRPNVIRDTSVIPSSIGDHEMIGAVRKANHVKLKPKEIEYRNYKSYVPEKVKNELLNSNWFPVYATNDVDVCWTSMKNILNNIFDKAAPKITKRIRGKPCAWLKAEITRELNKRDRLRRKYCKSKDPLDKETFRIQRNLVNNVVKKAKRNHHKEQLNNDTNNPDKFGDAIKQLYLTKLKKTEAKSFNIDGTNVTDPQKIASRFSRYFTNVVS